MARKAELGSSTVGERKRMQRCGAVPNWSSWCCCSSAQPPPSRAGLCGLPGTQCGGKWAGCGEDGGKARQQGVAAAGSARALSLACPVGGEEQQLDAAGMVFWRRSRVDIRRGVLKNGQKS
uniref:Uncharacterized protein n=1 Tax=Arundo donax TaxID=35708 RepID=A0A0A8ZG67_ARUDO